MGGAFGSLAGADVILNRQHDRNAPLARTGGGGLSLEDGPDVLGIRAELPPTREADDVLALVRSGVLRGLSVEFVSRSEHDEGGVRVAAPSCPRLRPVEDCRRSGPSTVCMPPPSPSPGRA